MKDRKVINVAGNGSLSSDLQTNKSEFFIEQFADLRILHYKVPGFEELSLKQKKLIYYLSQAALCGRDILYDQNGKYNLAIRRTLENILKTYHGDRGSENFDKFKVYLKQVWFSNGIYHHYSNDKILPGFDITYFRELVDLSEKSGFPVKEGQSPEDLFDLIIPVMFDPGVFTKKVSQDADKDLLLDSAVNFYQNVNQKEAEQFYSDLKKSDDDTPVSHGLNSRLVKTNGSLKEETWKTGGLYGAAIEKIVYWLEQAYPYCETKEQSSALGKLLEFYQSGDLKCFDKYNFHWLKDNLSNVDFINGFIETYSDPLGLKATWESVVSYKDRNASRRTEIISKNAQWFENHSPVDERFRKKTVKGISANVITVAQLGGDCYPHTPIGINLPNADWIRKIHGSKSVTLENITQAYHQADLESGFLEEFSFDDHEIELVRKYGFISNNLHVDLHECLGHGSGQLLPGVSVESLKNYHAPLEETRADLFALYYIMDPKMIELGLLPSAEAAEAQYISHIRNGMMTQLKRIEPGKDIEQAHMRNRQLISSWCYEKGKRDRVIEKLIVKGKTYFKINDFERLRQLFGKLLGEVQRIKSEGDYKAGKYLVETYGIKVDQDLHREVIERFEKLDMASYSGFVNPEFVDVKKGNKITDIEIRYPDSYTDQMMKYSEQYSFLPTFN